MSKKKTQKNILKAIYILLVVLCLLCIAGMLAYLHVDKEEEESNKDA